MPGLLQQASEFNWELYAKVDLINRYSLHQREHFTVCSARGAFTVRSHSWYSQLTPSLGHHLLRLAHLAWQQSLSHTLNSVLPSLTLDSPGGGSPGTQEPREGRGLLEVTQH